MSRMTSYIPTLDQIDELHQKIAPSQAAYDLVHMHCVVVATIARQLARHQNALFTNKLGQGSGNALDDSAGAAEQADLPSDGITGGRVPKRLIDEHLATIGGLLHDIGTYRVLKHDGSDGEPLQFDGKRYILHGLLGYEYLLEQDLPLPPVDYMPVNLEQEIVMVADKYNSKSIPPKFLTAQAYAKRAERYGEANKRRWLDLVDQYGVPDVPALAARFRMRMI